MKNSNTVLSKPLMLIMMSSEKFCVKFLLAGRRKEIHGTDANQSTPNHSGEVHPLSFHPCGRDHVRTFHRGDFPGKTAYGKRHSKGGKGAGGIFCYFLHKYHALR